MFKKLLIFIFTSFLFLNPTFVHAQEYDLFTNIVSYWSFDGAFKAQDVSGKNTNHGVTSGVTQSAALIASGNSYTFSATDTITFADDDTLDLTENITISFWLNFSNPSTDATLYIKGGAYEIRIINATDSLELTLTGVTSSPFDSGDIFSTVYDETHLYTITRNDITGDVIFYRDFTAITTISGGTEELTATANNLIIGDSSPAGYIGILDEVKMWDAVLSPAEILFMYTENPSASVITSQGLSAFISNWFSGLNLTDLQGSSIVTLIMGLVFYLATRSLMVSLVISSLFFIMFLILDMFPWYWILFLLWIPVSVIMRTLKTLLTPKEA